MLFKHAGVHKRIIVAALILILAGGLVLFLLQRKSMTLVPSRPVQDTPVRRTLSGRIICLPHKDTSGPQTMECAMGLSTKDGNYVLDTNLLQTQMPIYDTSSSLTANGVVTPIEMLSSDQWQRYDVKGIFSITDSVELTKN